MNLEKVVIIANTFDKVTKEANEALAIIYNTYSFHMGEEIIEVSRNGESLEYLTHDGKWVVRFAKKQGYTVKCSEIHAYLYAKTLLEGGYVKPEDMFNGDTTYAEMNTIATYLCNFIERTKKLANTKKGEDKK